MQNKCAALQQNLVTERKLYTSRLEQVGWHMGWCWLAGLCSQVWGVR
jgi:hypothetical protein